MRINVRSVENLSCDCAKLKEEIVALKRSVSENELQDEMVQPSRNDELAHELTASNIEIRLTASNIESWR